MDVCDIVRKQQIISSWRRVTNGFRRKWKEREEKEEGERERQKKQKHARWNRGRTGIPLAMEWGNYEEKEATASHGCHQRLVHVRRIANGTTRFVDVARSGLDLTEHSPWTNTEALSCHVHLRIHAHVFRLKPVRLGPGGRRPSRYTREKKRKSHQ